MTWMCLQLRSTTTLANLQQKNKNSFSSNACFGWNLSIDVCSGPSFRGIPQAKTDFMKANATLPGNKERVTLGVPVNSHDD